MKCAIVENEEFARDSLLCMISKARPDWKCLFMTESVVETVECMRSHASDIELVFMDIELDDGNCFKIFEKVSVECPIVFTTAYENFALKAFEANTVGYMLKPITIEKITEMINKIENLGRSLVSSIEPTVSPAKAKPFANHDRILISHLDDYSYVSSDEVAFFTAEDKCISVTLKNGNTFLTDFRTLNECLRILDPTRFFHVARNTITNIDTITKVSKHFKGRLSVHISAGGKTSSVIVSTARKMEFLEWLGHSR